MTSAETSALRDRMRERYAVHYSELRETAEAVANVEGDEQGEGPGHDDPMAPTPHW